MPERRSSIQDELKQRRPFRSKREELFLALLRTAACVRRPVAKVIEEGGVSLAQYNVLRILRGAGETGLPTLAIRERMIEEAAGITRLIDKLEAAGFVRRDRTNLADRRQVYCQVTDKGLSLLAGLDSGVLEAIELALGMLDETAMEELLELMDEIRAPARAAEGLVEAQASLAQDDCVTNGLEGA
jgi:MarR family transcriptional regulator, organic hydroperoxide resistance regulator